MVTCDIYSYCSRYSKYADRFDQVSIISRSGHVVILQNKKGRFPTNEKNIVPVDESKLKAISDIKRIIIEISERPNTTENRKRIQTLENKIVQILNQ